MSCAPRPSSVTKGSDVPYRFLVLMDESRVDLDAPPYRALDEYLQKRTEGLDRPRMCHILPLVGPPPMRRPLNSTAQASPTDIPWMTLVLGSECLEMQATGASSAGLGHEVMVRLADVFMSADENLESEEARALARPTGSFVQALVEDRLGATADARFGDQHSPFPDFPVWQLLFIHAAACLNDTYFRAMVLQARPVSRWGDEIVSLLGGTAAQSDELAGLVDVLKKRFGVLKASVPKGPLLGLVTRIGNALLHDGASVAVADVQAITEVSWYYLSLAKDVYPGWPELLIHLSLNPKAKAIRQDHPRPSFTSPDGTARVIQGLLRPPTEATARHLAESGEELSVRDLAYAQYAELLTTQAQIRAEALRRRYPVERRGEIVIDYSYAGSGSATRQAPASTTDQQDRSQLPSAPVPPPATAFVTTFDVELELALAWHHPEQPFVVAVPINLVEPQDATSTRRATSLWLGYIVRPPKNKRTSAQGLLEAVTKPQPEDWFVLSSSPIDAAWTEDTTLTGHPEGDPARHRLLPSGVSQLGALPIIVRLSGSPLVTLPYISQIHPDNPLTPLRTRALEVAFLSPDVDANPGPPANPETGSRVSDYETALDDPRLHFSHALLLEEHHSLRLSLPEVTGSSAATYSPSDPVRGDDYGENSGRGLPRSLTDGVRDGYWRYWTLLGVQVSDPVIRYRLVAQLIGAGLMHGQPAGYRRPKRSGLAINRNRANARATDLLLWSEFDMVTDTCERFTPEIGDYLLHLKKAVQQQTQPDPQHTAAEWPLVNEECEQP